MNLYPEPVKTMDGQILRLVAVQKGENTCLDCGHTTTADFCDVCAEGGTTEDKDAARNLVPTISYLLDDEFYIL